LKDAKIKIGLFFTGPKHAGENLDGILEKQSQGLLRHIQECDSSSLNVLQNNETFLANCLGHLRKKFYELIEVWPREVTKIIGEFSCVFTNEHLAPNDPEDRLKWHEEKSDPVMQKIKKYCDSLVGQKKVESNSSMGKAIAYLNNHWEAFTIFLRIPSVPLTNNESERLIKGAFLNRKTLIFSKTKRELKLPIFL